MGVENHLGSANWQDQEQLTAWSDNTVEFESSFEIARDI